MLLRLFVLGTLLFINLYACKGGYTSCIAKVKDSQSFTPQSLNIPLQKNLRLVYTHQQVHGEVIKYDPFLSLYLLKETKPFAYPFDINMRLQLGTAMVTSQEAREGKFIKDQIGLNSFATYSEPLLVPSLLTSSCCSLEGIVSSQGIIQKEYLNHFVHTKEAIYGDIGIRIEDRDSMVTVVAKDPFMKDSLFQKGDVVLSYDGKKIRSASQLMREILFAKLGTKHNVKIRRGTKSFFLHATTHKRYGGGFVSDTFLESKGLYFDNDLALVKITGSFKNYGLKLGDRLIQVNGVLIKNQEELREYIENFKDYSSLLFERNGFEFFVNIK